MKQLPLYILILFFSSCLKLDPNLYNNKQDIETYRWDAYDGEQDFVLDASYAIAADKMALIDLASQSGSEKEATTIKALYIGDVSRIATDTVIVYCHGNKWHMDFYWQRAKLLAHINGKHRYGVMMMDYRGFGLSEGKPSEEGMYADVDACLRWLKEKGLQDDRLVIYGFSLGSAPACELSSKPRSLTPSRLILEAPFASAEVMVQDASQLNMPAAYFTDLKIDNAEEIRQVNQPLFWLHGLNDNFLNYKTHGQVVYDHHHGRLKDHHLVKGADHGEVPAKMGFDSYLTTLGAFTRQP